VRRAYGLWRRACDPGGRDAAVVRDRLFEGPAGEAIHGARRYLADEIARIAAPHRLLDADARPLIAVRLSVLTRKTLGGLQTNLTGAVLDATGAPVPGLSATGEVAGFGGGGMLGYRALEGTFLGRCRFSGRAARRAVAAG
jgi:uncharacterized protein